MIREENNVPIGGMAAVQRPVAAQGDGGMNLGDLFKYILSKWYWIVIAVAVCLAYASYSVKKAVPMYRGSITVLFKGEKNGGAQGTASIPDYSDIGIKPQFSIINDEMFTLRSASIMVDVVDSLGINNQYLVKDGLHDRLLYKTSPYYVQDLTPIGDSVERNYSFDITLSKDNSTIEISDITGLGVEKGKVIKAKPGHDVTIGSVKFKITATDFMSKDYIGEPVKFVHIIPDVMAEQIAAAISWEWAQFSDSIVIISCTDRSPERAIDILNTLINVYNQHWLIERNRASETASAFIAERLQVIENELGEVDDHISQFRSANLMGDDGSLAQGALARLQQSQSQKLDLSNKINLVKYLRREVQNASLEQTLPNPAGIEGTTVETQLQQYNNNVMERNRMLATSSENNPLVQDRTNTLNTLKQTMVASIDNLLMSLNSQMSTIQTQEARSTADLMRSPSQANYLLGVERKQKVKESLYLFLLQRREQNELDQAFMAYNTRIIAKATAIGPVSPKSGIIMGIALGIGLLVPILIMFIIKTFDTKIRSRKDLSNLSAPFLGEIPQVTTKKSVKERIDKLLRRKPEYAEKRPIVVKRGSRDAVNEAFRVMRANFEFVGNVQNEKKGAIHTIIGTSLYAGSGKTFTMLNLGSALAAKGNKVVLVDLDMRKGTMSSSMAPHREGISNFIVGKNTLEEIIVHDIEGIEGLDLIPVGPIPPNPSETLYSHKFESLINDLKEQYEYVLIDCPPVEIVADTQIIARLADMTIFVVRAGLFAKSDVQRLEEYYASGRYPNLVVVLNGIDINSAYHGHYGLSMGKLHYY